MGNRYNVDQDIVDEIIALKKRIESLERRPRMSVASLGDVEIGPDGQLLINGGVVRMIDQDGQDSLFMGGASGDLTRPDGNPQPIYMLYRDDGSYVLTVFDPDPLDGTYAQYWQMYDRNQNPIVGDDRLSGDGLSRPYLNWNIRGKSQTETTTVTTPTWDTMFTLRGVKQHPKLRVKISATSPASTTGSVRLFHVPSSTVLAGPNSIAASTTITPTWDADLLSPTFLHMDEAEVEIQAQRLTGSGTISVQALTVFGRES